MSLGFASSESVNHGSKAVFSIRCWESMATEGWLYALICAILYKGLEHPQILVSAWILEPIPHRYQGMNVDKFLGNQKLYTEFWLCRWPVPQPLHCPRVNCIPNIGEVIAQRDAPLSRGCPAAQYPCDPSADTGLCWEGRFIIPFTKLSWNSLLSKVLQECIDLC